MNQRRCAELRDVPGCPDLATIFRIADVPVGMGTPSGWVAAPADVLPTTHYWSRAAGAPVPFPPRPGPGHAFDFERLEWVPDAAELWGYVRARRDELLRECDWRVLPDAPTPDDVRQAWLAYRQALRDVTEQGDPRMIVWPYIPDGR